MRYIATINGNEFVIEIDHEHEVVVNGERMNIDFQYLEGDGVLSLLINHRSLEAVVHEREDVWDVLADGELYSVQVQDERAYRLAQARSSSGDHAGEATIKSPMPGLIVAVPVVEGQAVKKGEKVVILESMKMENELKAPTDGVVARVHVSQGDSVEKDQVLIVILDPDALDDE